MKGMVISTESASDFKLIADLVKKLGIASAAITEEQIEDLGLTLALKSVNKTKKVSRDKVLRKLSD